MTRRKLVQFWTHEKYDNERLDSDILILHRRVWERASLEAQREDRKAILRTTGKLLLTVAGCIAYIWILGR